MRKLIPFAALLAAGCASTPPATPVASPAMPVQPQRGDLIGLSAGDLLQRLGRPALQIREGQGLKLQFRGQRCILDAYLYPVPGGVERVAHVDTRLATGAQADRQSCIAAFQGA